MALSMKPWSDSEIAQIRERAGQMEKEGRVDPEFLSGVIERKLFKLFVPVELGGLMATMPEAAEVFEEASWIDGGLGWTVAIGSGGGFFVPYLPPEAASALFSPAEAVLAGSGMPAGTAKRVDGGYVVSGTWRYCSGSRHATFFTANARIIDQDAGSTDHANTEELNIRSFAFLPEQVQIIQDWNAFGLKASDSHSIEVQEAFVPDERIFSIMGPAYPTYRAPLYDYPFSAFAVISFASVTLGIGRHFLEEAHRMLERHRDGWEASKPGRSSFMEVLINEGECAYEEAKRNFTFHIQRSWDELQTHGRVSEQTAQDCMLQSKSAAQAMRAMADSIFPCLGMGAIMENSAINQIWRDLHTACQHSMLVSFQE